MKAISLWQPWASAIAVGAKRVETRSWGTSYRGPLAIHAAKRCVKDELIHIHSCWNWCGALRPLGVQMGDRRWLWDLMPFGAVVAVAELADCRPSGTFTVSEIETPRRPDGEQSALYDWTERQMGDFGPGRFGWVLKNIRALPEPIPFRGAQGFFDVPDELLSCRPTRAVVPDLFNTALTR